MTITTLLLALLAFLSTVHGFAAENPCAGKACGDECTQPCPPGMACPAVMYYCQSDGMCSHNAAPECEKDLCAQYHLGQSCITADNLAECRKLAANGCTELVVKESCPLQFDCDDM
eukprot:CAMPEP_0119325122 /NCGR_PEP_ID=MMETSP1333-20130426/65027_1 /TAXON_ID=418940 /ORGANISM="Scyphosphaera apsteinii, Strain RCC1455" /LENGTH=115 /DNA_ID=CAMNT_0007333011 /DNA_START=93 /DNA_END=440 /DNA_ORIENTATION=-